MVQRGMLKRYKKGDMHGKSEAELDNFEVSGKFDLSHP